MNRQIKLFFEFLAGLVIVFVIGYFTRPIQHFDVGCEVFCVQVWYAEGWGCLDYSDPHHPVEVSFLDHQDHQ